MAMTTDAPRTMPVDERWLGPLVVHADGPTTLPQLSAARHAEFAKALDRHGAILFRGFGVTSPAAFRQAAIALGGTLLDYVYRSTPRTALEAKVFTATEYPATATIPMHNENSYQREWPMKLTFGCIQAAPKGGETPLAANRRVTQSIDADVRREFARRGVMYVRNYGQGVDLTWQTVFQTDSRAEVERFCVEHGIEWEWIGADQLRTRQTCQGLAVHPRTGEELWFNQAHLFHVSSLSPAQQAAMLDLFGEANLPRHSYWGDGSPFDAATLGHIRAAYDSESQASGWENGDVLLLDNMLTVHGRRPFEGPRTVLVAMSQTCDSTTARSTQSQREVI